MKTFTHKFYYFLIGYFIFGLIFFGFLLIIYYLKIPVNKWIAYTIYTKSYLDLIFMPLIAWKVIFRPPWYKPKR